MRRYWKRLDGGSCTPEVFKKKVVSRCVYKNERHTNSQCRCPDVLGITDIKEIELEGCY